MTRYRTDCELTVARPLSNPGFARFDAEVPLRYPLLNPLSRPGSRVFARSVRLRLLSLAPIRILRRLYAWFQDGHPRGEAIGSEGNFLSAPSLFIDGN
jgi:hypothetical protein